MIVRTFKLFLIGIFCCSVGSIGSIFGADDKPTPGSVPAEKKQADDKATEKEDPQANPYKVPEGSADELLKFIDNLRGLRPQGNNPQEMIENFKRAGAAIVEAADKILAGKPEEKVRAAATRAKLEALGRLSQVGLPGAVEQLKKFAEELKQGPDADLAKDGQLILLQLRARKLMMGDVEDAEALLAEVTKQLAAAPDDPKMAQVALGIAQALEYSGKTDKLAAQAYHSFAEVLAKSNNPDIARSATKLDGVIRRLELVGKPIEITGTLLDGKAFDQTSLKGKVILVDFWATWCGPCVAELPNVVENYKKYHDKGFEVIGISLDQDRDKLEQFVKTREIPWPILFEEKGESQGWANPIATKYGIMAIPTVILVGPDGNVVSLRARGPELGQLLAKLLGPVKDDADDSTKEKGNGAS